MFGEGLQRRKTRERRVADMDKEDATRETQKARGWRSVRALQDVLCRGLPTVSFGQLW